MTFLVVFLGSAFVLLAAGRYAITGPVMNRYLFYVACHTSRLLNVVGHSSRVENPALYQGREAEIRAKLEAWRRGEDAAAHAVKDAAEPPLTPWEIWQFRVAELRSNLAIEEQRLHVLDPLPAAQVHGREEHVAHIRRRIDQLEQAIQRPGPYGCTPVTRSDIQHAFGEVKVKTEHVARDPSLDDEAFAQALLAIEAELEDLRAAQALFLHERARALVQDLRNQGPVVIYTARPGGSARLRLTRPRLEEIEGDPARDADPRADRAARTESDVAVLTEKGGAPPNDSSCENGDRRMQFSFKVVPDCGAIPSMAIFLSAIIAFPAGWRRKLPGIALGLPVLYVVNVCRLACLATIGAWDSSAQWLTFAHEYVWQGIYIIFVVVIWLLWVELLVRRRRTCPGKAH